MATATGFATAAGFGIAAAFGDTAGFETAAGFGIAAARGDTTGLDTTAGLGTAAALETTAGLGITAAFVGELVAAGALPEAAPEQARLSADFGEATGLAGVGTAVDVTATAAGLGLAAAVAAELGLAAAAAGAAGLAAAAAGELGLAAAAAGAAGLGLAAAAGELGLAVAAAEAAGASLAAAAAGELGLAVVAAAAAAAAGLAAAAAGELGLAVAAAGAGAGAGASLAAAAAGELGLAAVAGFGFGFGCGAGGTNFKPAAACLWPGSAARAFSNVARAPAVSPVPFSAKPKLTSTSGVGPGTRLRNDAASACLSSCKLTAPAATRACGCSGSVCSTFSMPANASSWSPKRTRHSALLNSRAAVGAASAAVVCISNAA